MQTSNGIRTTESEYIKSGFSGQAPHYARISREVCIHRIATAESADEALEFTAILLSWCGPHSCEYVVFKDVNGYIPAFTSEKGNYPIRLSTETVSKLQPLEFTGLLNETNRIRRLSTETEIPRATAYRVYRRKLSTGAWCLKLGAIVLDELPAHPTESTAIKIEVSLGKTYIIAGKTFSTMGLPENLRTETEEAMDRIVEEWRTELRDLKHRLIARAELTLSNPAIKEEEQNSRTAVADPAPAAAVEEPVVPITGEDKDLAAVAELLPLANEKTATQFLEVCRKKAPDFTVPQIVAAAYALLRERRGVNDQTAFLLKVFPDHLDALQKRANRAAAA